MAAIAIKERFRAALAVQTEQVIHAGPCVLYGIYPDLTTAGTITIRNTATAAAGAAEMICAIGLTQQGKQFDGIRFDTGLTVQLSNAADAANIAWAAIP